MLIYKVLKIDILEINFMSEIAQIDDWFLSMTHWINGGESVSFKKFPWSDDHLKISLEQRFHLFKIRESFISHFGYALPNAEFIDEVAQMGKILEVGAGTGYLSQLIYQKGVEVIATDPGETLYLFESKRWFEVLEMDANKAIEKNPDHTVLMAWPCLNENWANEALLRMKNRQKIIFIGEEEGGCTANSSFFQTLEYEFEKIRALPWKSFPMMNDKASVYIKK